MHLEAITHSVLTPKFSERCLLRQLPPSFMLQALSLSVSLKQQQSVRTAFFGMSPINLDWMGVVGGGGDSCLRQINMLTVPFIVPVRLSFHSLPVTCPLQQRLSEY